MKKYLLTAIALLATATIVAAASWKTTETEDTSVNGGEIIFVENEGGTDNNWMALSTVKTYVQADIPTITWGTGLTDTSNTISVTHPVTAETYGSGWNANTDGAQKNDIYDYLHQFDTDDNGKVDVLDSGFLVETIAGISMDGGGAVIPDGVKGDKRVPFAAHITTMTILATDASCSITVDVWKDTYANFPPTVDDAITIGGKPTISSSNKGQITGLNIAVSAGDIIRFNVDSNDCTGKVVLTIDGTRD